jgi:hypothetical protein
MDIKSKPPLLACAANRGGYFVAGSLITDGIASVRGLYWFYRYRPLFLFSQEQTIKKTRTHEKASHVYFEMRLSKIDIKALHPASTLALSYGFW